MTPEEKQQAIKRILPVLMDEFAQYGILDHCIEASALLMKVLHNTGMPDAYRLTVGVQIINEAAYRHTETHGAPDSAESAKAFKFLKVDGVAIWQSSCHTQLAKNTRSLILPSPR